jgi:hypothetical protein
MAAPWGRPRRCRSAFGGAEFTDCLEQKERLSIILASSTVVIVSAAAHRALRFAEVGLVRCLRKDLSVGAAA